MACESKWNVDGVVDERLKMNIEYEKCIKEQNDDEQITAYDRNKITTSLWHTNVRNRFWYYFCNFDIKKNCTHRNGNFFCFPLSTSTFLSRYILCCNRLFDAVLFFTFFQRKKIIKNNLFTK